MIIIDIRIDLLVSLFINISWSGKKDCLCFLLKIQPAKRRAEWNCEQETVIYSAARTVHSSPANSWRCCQLEYVDYLEPGTIAPCWRFTVMGFPDAFRSISVYSSVWIHLSSLKSVVLSEHCVISQNKACWDLCSAVNQNGGLYKVQRRSLLMDWFFILKEPVHPKSIHWLRSCTRFVLLWSTKIDLTEKCFRLVCTVWAPKCASLCFVQTCLWFEQILNW